MGSIPAVAAAMNRTWNPCFGTSTCYNRAAAPIPTTSNDVIVLGEHTRAFPLRLSPGYIIQLDARFQNPPLGGFKHVESLCGTPGIVSLLKTWFFQLCMIASTLFWSNSMDTFNGLIVLRIHF